MSTQQGNTEDRTNGGGPKTVGIIGLGYVGLPLAWIMLSRSKRRMQCSIYAV